MRRLDVLDGWRAISIALVLAGHLIPLGPASAGLNFAIAGTGMALFFVLSGFLITRFLLHRPDVPSFLLRRFFRIVPLAWLAVLVLAIASQAGAGAFFANVLFVSNLGDTHLMTAGEHLWSLGVEVQFYVGVALLVAFAGRRGLYALPVAAVIITVVRIDAGAWSSIQTVYRVDEVLAGATLALAWHRWGESAHLLPVPRLTSLALLPVLVASSYEQTLWLPYLRPYLAALVVGASLVAMPVLMHSVMTSRILRYIAAISYALYVLHVLLAATWLGSGSAAVRYLKRPLLGVALLVSAHVSTFYFERPTTSLGKRLEQRYRQRGRPEFSDA